MYRTGDIDKQKTRNMYTLENGIYSERGGRRGLSGEMREWDVRAKSDSPELGLVTPGPTPWLPLTLRLN